MTNTTGPQQHDPPPPPREPLDLRTVVLLALAGAAGALAYQSPNRWGVGLAVGIAAATALHALIRRN